MVEVAPTPAIDTVACEGTDAVACLTASGVETMAEFIGKLMDAINYYRTAVEEVNKQRRAWSELSKAPATGN